MNDTGDGNGELVSSFQAQDAPQEAERPPVSRAELEHLKAQRDTPQADLHLRPPGHIANQVDARVSQLREQKIGYMERRLEATRHLARDDFNKTQQSVDLKSPDLDR